MFALRAFLRHHVACLSFAVLGLTAAEAHAGGFEVPDLGARAVGRGGAYTVGVADGTALYYNPAALAKMRGTTLTYHHGLAFHDTRFQRAPLGEGLPDPMAAWGTNAGTTFDEVESRRKLFPLLIALTATSDFGLENWTFAIGAFGPNGIGRQDFPDYGPQSFMLTDLDVIVLYYTLGAAWKWKDKVGIGAAVHYADMARMRYGVVADSALTPTLNPVPDSGSTQLVTLLDLKDRTSATATLGLWYRPHKRFELGLSSRIVPVFFEPEGSVRVDKDTLVTRDITAKTKITLPAIVRGGVRYIHDTGAREWFDLELDVVYESWSVIKSFDLEFEGQINGQDLQPLSLRKNWGDTVSVRLGGDFNAVPKYFTVRAGGYYESPAAPNNFSHIDFASFHRGGIGLGFSAGAKGAYVTVGYTHVFQESREVTELQAKTFQQRPLATCPDSCNGLSGVPANAGRITSSFDLLTFGIDLRFREMLEGRRQRKAKAKEATPAPAPAPEPEPATTAPASAPDASEPEPETETETEPESETEPDLIPEPSADQPQRTTQAS